MKIFSLAAVVAASCFTAIVATAQVSATPDSPFKLANPEARDGKIATSKPPPLLPADLPARLTDLETEMIEAALERSRFNQKVAANMLGLSYHQFRGRLRKLSISGSPPTS